MKENLFVQSAELKLCLREQKIITVTIMCTGHDLHNVLIGRMRQMKREMEKYNFSSAWSKFLEDG